MPPFPTKHQTGNESSHDSGFRVYTEVKVEGLGYRRYRRAEFRASRRKRCGRNVEEIVISNTGYRLALCVYLHVAACQNPGTMYASRQDIRILQTSSLGFKF